tara:strand:- start:15106 stop:16695 length:1590 start_codon:yes stop_codon:yes gene_type:complete
MASPKMRLLGIEGQPGLQAWGLHPGPQSARPGENPWGRGTLAVHPNVVPDAIFSEVGMPGGTGVAAIGGRPIVNANIQPFSYDRAVSHGLSGGHSGFIGIGSKAGTYREGIQKEADRYSGQFRQHWYDPYIHAAIDSPIKDVLQATTAPAANILPQNVVQGYTGPRGSFAHGAKVLAPVASNAAVDVGGLAQDLEWAEKDYTQSLANLDTQRGFTADKEAFIETRRQEYDEDIQDVEAEKGRRSADFEKSKIAAHKTRMEALRGGATARSALLLGNLAGYEKAQAPIARSGFASSGPAQAAFEASQAPLQERLRASTTGQRDVETKFQDKIGGLEDRWSEQQVGFQQRVQDIERMKDDLATEELDIQQEYAAHDLEEQKLGRGWRDSKRGYIKGVMDLSKAVGEDISSVSDWIGSITGAHKKFGTALDESMVWPGTDQGYRFRIRNEHKANIAGQQTFGAPTGGWFRETGGLQGVTAGEKDVQAAQMFGDYLGRLTEADFAKTALGDDWQDLGVGDIDYGELEEGGGKP